MSAIDPPATIAILGAGPVGLETALYARYLGYRVVVLEQQEVAARVRRSAHVRLSRPFGHYCSSLGLAALRAQRPDYRPPEPHAPLLAGEWVEAYLAPLARTDLVAAHIRPHVRVRAVEHDRAAEAPGVPADSPSPAAFPFRVVAEDRQGEPLEIQADVVIDATGTAEPLGCGPHGKPAAGERRALPRVSYHVPDVLGSARTQYANQHTLLVGTTCTAAATASALAQLIDSAPRTRVDWIGTPVVDKEREFDPVKWDVARCVAQRLAPVRQQTTRHGTFRCRWEHSVRALEPTDAGGPLRVHFADEHEQPVPVDRIVINAGRQPDWSLLGALRVPICPHSAAPMPIANWIHAMAGPELRRPTLPWRELLPTGVPNCYVLGAKSFGRRPGYWYAIGLDQIRALFQLIGGRATLDLYATF